jgi:putative transposase
VRGNWFVGDDICIQILQWFEGYRAKYGLICYGYVLMPDHLHALLQQTGDGNPVSDAIGGFKRMASIKSRPIGYPEGSLWRATFDDVPVPGSEAAMTKLAYMHNNPIRRGIVEQPESYLWSSAAWYTYDTDEIIKLTRP